MNNEHDIYSGYEIGLGKLLEGLGKEHPRYSEALVYQQRLVENIKSARLYGDSEASKAQRAEIIHQLNRFVLSTLNITFDGLCEGSTSTPRKNLSSPTAGHTTFNINHVETLIGSAETVNIKK